MILKLKGKICDIETAFLHGDLEEEIYMEAPKGISADDDEVVKLEQTIYGLVQSARQFWKKLRDVLKTLRFGGGDIDPCLLYKKTDKGITLIGLYVDDLLIIGDPNEIDEVIAGLKKHFSVKVEDEINDYLSCKIQFSEDGTKAWIGQPHLIAKMAKTFNKEIKNLKVFATPGTPSFHIARPEEKDEVSTKEKQLKYRTGVGMLLFLVKHS